VLSSYTVALSDKPQKNTNKSASDSDVNQVVQPSIEKQRKAAEKKRQAAAKEAQRSKGGNGPSKGETAPKDPMNSATFSGLELRSIGPAVVAGRIVSIAVNPRNRANYYIGAASGGLWRTDNDGGTWTPVFDDEGSYSIGTVVLDPKDPNIVWVGTGENNSQRSVAYGDGVYRSEDGGKSWTNLGLKHSEHIARIVINPKDTNIVYVASQGPLWGPGGDRGLFKTTDGGKTWKNVLSISENTGVSDVVMDPRDPDVLYASSYQRRRHVWTLIDGGPESAIYKTTDGGTHWDKLKAGLPTVDMGRIGLAIAPSEPDTLYAIIEASDKKGGIFRSKDGGESWEKRNPWSDATAMYYGTLFVDPKNSDRIYVMGFNIRVSNDGGKTLTPIGEHSKHVDNHVIWIDPHDPDYYLVGCDGGVYETYDRGATWIFKHNLPLGQFYDVAVDNASPFYNVYGGTQDNSSWGGPSRTLTVNGAFNSDWFFTNGGDGFRSAIDPVDPNTVYAEYQYGNLLRFDRRTGERAGIQPQDPKDQPPLRWSWDSPIVVSKHDHNRLYFAANVLFRSDDRGNSWKQISGDLTRHIDRDSLPVMGKIWGPDAVAKNASTDFYGNIVAFSESPKDPNLLFVGTDDGLIQTTNDGGATWKRLDKFAGVPERTYVSRLFASNFDTHVVYASFDNHKNEDFKPYLLKSTDGGTTWTSISSNLPENGAVLAFCEDYVNPNLLFAGTEFGLWFSIDGGGKWVQLKGGLPTISIHDILEQQREGDLVVASFGRGFYILDDLTPLRQLTAAQLDAEAVVSPVKDALLYVPAAPIGSGGKGWFGEQTYVAPNPPFGAIFTYYLKEKYKTLKEKREEAEKDEAKKNDGAAYPTLKYPNADELRAEAEEQPPALWFTVTDAEGNVVSRVSAPNKAGWNRVAWDLHFPPVELPKPKGVDDDDEGPATRLALPGKYNVRLSKKVEGQWTDLGTPVSFNVVALGTENMNPNDRATLEEFQRKLLSLDRAVGGAINLSNEMNQHLEKIREALNLTPAHTTLLQQQVDALEARTRKVLITLDTDKVLQDRQDQTRQSINDRINQIEEAERFSTQLPAKTDVDAYELAAGEFTPALAEVHSIHDAVTALEQQVEKLGAPWTPSRVPEWQEK